MLDEKLQSILMGMTLAELSTASDSRTSDQVLFATIHDLSWTMLTLRVAQVVRRNPDPALCAHHIWQTVQTFFAPKSVPHAYLVYPIWVFPVGLLPVSHTAMQGIAADLATIAGLDADFALAMMLLAQGSQNDMPIAAMLNLLHVELSDRYERNLLRVGHVLTWGSEQHALNHLHTPTGTGAVLAQSLYLLFRYVPDIDTAIRQSVRVKFAPEIVSLIVGLVAGGLAHSATIALWQSTQLFCSIQDELATG